MVKHLKNVSVYFENFSVGLLLLSGFQVRTTAFNKHFDIRKMAIYSGVKSGQLSKERGCMYPNLFGTLLSLNQSILCIPFPTAKQDGLQRTLYQRDSKKRDGFEMYFSQEPNIFCNV